MAAGRTRTSMTLSESNYDKSNSARTCGAMVARLTPDQKVCLGIDLTACCSYS